MCSKYEIHHSSCNDNEHNLKDTCNHLKINKFFLLISYNFCISTSILNFEMSICMIFKFPIRCRVQNCLLEVPPWLLDNSSSYWSTTSIEVAKGAVTSWDSCSQSIGIWFLPTTSQSSFAIKTPRNSMTSTSDSQDQISNHAMIHLKLYSSWISLI